MKVICISGKAEHGKDYTANLMVKTLQEEGYRVRIAHYGDLVKFIAKQYFDWNGVKDEAGRALLQYIGTEVIRKQDPDYFVNFVADMFRFFPDKWDYALIPDTRFPNEIIRMYEKGFDTRHIRVFRENHKSILTEEQLKHSSETALDVFPVDYRCENPGDETYDEIIRNFVLENFLPNESTPAWKRRKLRIMVDIDDTLWDLLDPWLAALNEQYGTNVKKEDVTEWDLKKVFPSEKGSIYAPLRQKGFWNNVLPNPDSQHYLKKLIEDGHEVFIVSSTSPMYDSCTEKMQRFAAVYPFVDTHNIVLCHNKQIIQADVLIDDGVHNLTDGNYAKILFHQNHNRNFNETEIGAVRVHNWKQVYREVERITMK